MDKVVLTANLVLILPGQIIESTQQGLSTQ